MSRILTLWMLLAAFPLTAEAQVSLVYAPDLQTGQVLRTEVDLETKQTLTVAGMPLETANTSFIVSKQTIGDKTPEGGRTIQGEYEVMQSEMSLPGGIKITFNSNNPAGDGTGNAALDEITAVLKATAEAKWTLTTDANHKVISAAYVGEPFANIGAMFKNDTNPDLLKRKKNTERARYPQDPVNVGDSWERTEAFEAGGGQTLEFQSEFTLLGSEERDGRQFDKVGIKVLSVKLNVEDNPAVPAKVTESDLKIADSQGTLWYDRQARAFTEGDEKVHITGTLTLEVAGMKLPGELDLTIESKSKTKPAAP